MGLVTTVHLSFSLALCVFSFCLFLAHSVLRLVRFSRLNLGEACRCVKPLESQGSVWILEHGGNGQSSYVAQRSYRRLVEAFRDA